MESIASLIEAGTAILQNAGIPEPRREAASFLEIAIGRDRAFVIAHPDHLTTPDQTKRFRECVDRRALREPFHYITGSKEFYGLEFAVSPAVLIPRPETEMLVERGIALLGGVARPRFCEVGVGSGCISIALLVNLPRTRAVGLDISRDAIKIAAENGLKHCVGERLDLRESDVFHHLADNERFDLIVSNPPYVPAIDLAGLQDEVRKHEPRSALTDGRDGLSIIRRLVIDSPRFLKPNGSLILEFGFSQAGQVSALFKREIWRSVQFRADLQGIPRVVEAVLGS